MVDLITHLIAWCQSCVPDAQSAAPAVGIIGGTAGAIGAIGGLGGGLASSGSGSDSGADAPPASGGETSPTDGDTSPTGGDTSASGDGADGDGPNGLAEPSSPFNDTTGGFQMHEPPDPPEYPDDPFHSPSENPQPIFSDGSQVDGSNKPGDDTTETDYINPDGTPLGSSPPAPHHTPGAPPHKPK